MPRSVNTVASRARRKKVLKLAKGNYGSRGNVWTVAKNTVEKGLQYAYRDRRTKKRNFRALWIQRINAGVREYGLSYSTFMGKVHAGNLNLSRKVLADLALNNPEAFKAVVEQVKDLTPQKAADTKLVGAGLVVTAAPRSAKPVKEAGPKQVKAPKAEKPAAPKAEKPATPKVAKAAAPIVEEPIPVAPEVEEAPVSSDGDNLKLIEGIGPAIEKILNGSGITTWAQLADKSADELRAILEQAGSRYTMHKPDTWPKQAELAAAGKFDELKAWQDELDGGKE
ncbi:MAG: 50S ribosomal protein L20 [Bacteroidetes bacterium]|nr:50S ribosomal protein L20 [Bacteroidota bacterium]